MLLKNGLAPAPNLVGSDRLGRNGHRPMNRHIARDVRNGGVIVQGEEFLLRNLEYRAAAERLPRRQLVTRRYRLDFGVVTADDHPRRTQATRSDAILEVPRQSGAARPGFNRRYPDQADGGERRGRRHSKCSFLVHGGTLGRR
jgi:hypothetical protein